MTGDVMHTTREVAARFKVGPRKVRQIADELRVGARLAGAAGWRFTDDEVEQMRRHLLPVQTPPARRRTSRRRSP